MANQSDFQASIAQNYVSFATTFQITPNPGQNFQNVILFVGSGESVVSSGTTGVYFPTISGAPSVGTLFTANGNNYATQFGGALLAWASEFFSGNNNLSNFYVAVFDDSATVGNTIFPSGAVTALNTQYTAYKELAFFKLISENQAGDGRVALASMCQPDVKLLSQCWMTTNDIGTLTASGVIVNEIKAAGYDAVVIYDQNNVTVGTGTVPVNAALVQLGLTLGSINNTGTSVGNSVDMLQTSYVGPSGPLNTSLSATAMVSLANQNVGFFLYVGNTTGMVALRGGKTIANNLSSALWVTAYVDYMCAISTATYLSQYNRFKNNSTYQAILSFVSYYLNLFNLLGRFTNGQITAPTWATAQTLSDGQTIIIPNAWQATFNDSIRNVTVNGTLYISAS